MDLHLEYFNLILKMLRRAVLTKPKNVTGEDPEVGFLIWPTFRSNWFTWGCRTEWKSVISKKHEDDVKEICEQFPRRLQSLKHCPDLIWEVLAVSPQKTTKQKTTCSWRQNAWCWILGCCWEPRDPGYSRNQDRPESPLSGLVPSGMCPRAQSCGIFNIHEVLRFCCLALVLSQPENQPSDLPAYLNAM